MVRLDACGRVRWTLMEGNHHSVTRAADGSFWVPGLSSQRRSKSKRYPDGFPNLGGRKIWVDKILNVSEEREVLSSTNVIDIIYESGSDRYIEKMMGGMGGVLRKKMKTLIT